MKILVTGSCGFIGMHTALRLLERGDEVFGIDNFSDYYDVNLKKDRLAQLEGRPGFEFERLELSDSTASMDLFKAVKPDRVVHLAAQAGVRYSITNPLSYVDSNLSGFVNVIEGCRHQSVEHLVYASSSSVYGGNRSFPYAEHQTVDHPVSLYAATKKANELIAHSYSHLYSLPTTGLRFFTVYGPWGRPDMALFKFASAIAQNRPIDIYNNGKMSRDFTFIDDIVEGVMRVLDKVPQPASVDESNDASSAPYKVFNIGNGRPQSLMQFIEALEQAMGKKAQRNYMPLQAGDVVDTHADTSALQAWVGYKPDTDIQPGVARFVEWFNEYYADKS